MYGCKKRDRDELEKIYKKTNFKVQNFLIDVFFGQFYKIIKTTDERNN